MENNNPATGSWREHITKEFPEPKLRFREHTTPFRRARRKDSWTKEFKEWWKPLEDWKLPKKISSIRAGDDGFVGILEAPVGGDWFTSRLVEGDSCLGTVEKTWRLRRDWDRKIYGKSVHDAFKGWPHYTFNGPDGKPFIVYEGEFYRLLGKYSTDVTQDQREDALQQLIALRFEYGWHNIPPRPLSSGQSKPSKKNKNKSKKKARKQTKESKRTRKEKRKRLRSLATDDYIDNGGHLTLSLPPDPTLDLDEKERRWKEQRTAWCKELHRICERYGIQLDWFLEVSWRKSGGLRWPVESAHYHMFWHRQLVDRFSFPEVREGFLSDVRSLAVKIWNINDKGLLDRPINNEHHMDHLKEDYLAKAANDDVEIAWGRYYGRINPVQKTVRATLTKEQHFKLRRIQARAQNHHLPNIAVDISGPMKSSALLKTLESMGVPYEIEEHPLVVRDLVTEVSHHIPDTSTPSANKSVMESADRIAASVLYSSAKRTRGVADLTSLKMKQQLSRYHVIGRDEVKLPKDGPLFRQIDAVPDHNRIDIGAFSIDVRNVESWAQPHSMTPPLSEEDLLVLSETVRRSQRVLMPIFLDQDGRLLHGAENVLAVAAIQTGEEPVQIDRLPAIYLYVEDQAAEAELMMNLNVGRVAGTQSEHDERRRRAVRTLLFADHAGTDRLIAGLCGLKDSTVVKRIRLQMEEGGDIERREAFVDRRGARQVRSPDYDAKPTREARPTQNTSPSRTMPERGARQASVDAHDSHDEPEEAVAAEMSGPDTSSQVDQDGPVGRETCRPEQNIDEAAQQDSVVREDAAPKHKTRMAFYRSWYKNYGSRPVWPEELTVLSSEFDEPVPVEPGQVGFYQILVHWKPDGSDRVLTLTPQCAETER